ncbi:MAG: MBL fold metallo-hydrolase [Novosphingobium sp.]|nr:MAG: MBL fold metallo-hydrolase [Novosphingobium sp.]
MGKLPFASLLVCATALATGPVDAQSHPASTVTRAANQTALTAAAEDEAREAIEDAAARRGLIATLPDGVVRNSAGEVILDRRDFAFLNDPVAPASVHPRLWRQARRDAQHGLFEVVPDAIWQLRGYDVAVMTFIKTDSGVIVVDPLTTEEAARSGWALFREKVGGWPIRAILFSHSHVDHFGGVRGVIDAEAVARDKIPIIAPHGFTEEAVSENVLAGPAMLARAEFMFAGNLSVGPQGHVDTGLGPRGAKGTSGFMQPNRLIGPEGASITIDGLELIIADAARTEAPAEYVFYVPRYKALHSTEVVTKTFHNLLTPRGAQIRDGLRWSQVIDQMLQRWGSEAQVRLGSHGWPTFGGEDLRRELVGHRDIYRFVHDRTLAAANSGATIQELPDILEAAPGLAPYPTARGYYGTINHNAKAVYQRYFGWWDGVPADYDPLPPEEASRGYVALAGGPKKLLAAGRRAYDAGNYRWAATLFNHLVFADATDTAAKSALADAYEQIGYQAESGAWRNYYLVAAARLRGEATPRALPVRQSASFVAAIPTLDFFNALATRYAPTTALAEPRILRFVLTDTRESIAVELSGIVANPRAEAWDAAKAPTAAEVRTTRRALLGLIGGEAKIADLLAAKQIELSGDLALLQRWTTSLRPITSGFNIVTP